MKAPDTRYLRALIVTDGRLVLRDRMLAFLLGYCLLLALAVRLAVPPLGAWLASEHGIDLEPYHVLFGSFVGLTLGSTLVGMIMGFVLLEVRESRVLDAIAVSPLSLEGYLGYRVAAPIVVSIFLNPICAWIAGVGLPPVGPLLLLSVAGSLMGGLAALLLAAFAEDKVQGFAVMKMLSALAMLPLAAYFVREPSQWLFSLFPPYLLFKAWWMAADMRPGWWLPMLGGLILNGLALRMMVRRLTRSLLR